MCRTRKANPLSTSLGGHKANEYVPMGEVRAYNVATNTWTSKQDMPGARYEMNGAAVIGGKIYVTEGLRVRISRTRRPTPTQTP
jgi:hypothetical protein